LSLEPICLPIHQVACGMWYNLLSTLSLLCTLYPTTRTLITCQQVLSLLHPSQHGYLWTALLRKSRLSLTAGKTLPLSHPGCRLTCCHWSLKASSIFQVSLFQSNYHWENPKTKQRPWILLHLLSHHLSWNISVGVCLLLRAFLICHLLRLLVLRLGLAQTPSSPNPLAGQDPLTQLAGIFMGMSVCLSLSLSHTHTHTLQTSWEQKSCVINSVSISTWHSCCTEVLSEVNVEMSLSEQRLYP
jgi:hypothetical protein